MKRLSLKNLKLEAHDVLQGSQLKTVFGGYSGGGEDSCSHTKLTFVYNDGRANYVGVFSTNGNGCSSWSQQQCANVLQDPHVQSCYYDCCNNGY